MGISALSNGTRPTGSRTEFVYDGLSRRVQILESDGSAKSFVWSGNAIAEERDASGANVTKRFFAQGEQRIGGDDAGNYYDSRDHLGSVREVTDASGVVKAQYVRRNKKGQFKTEVDVGRSLAADRRHAAKSTVEPGQGDRGDVKR